MMRGGTMAAKFKKKAKKIFNPLRWGLRIEAINDLGKRLKEFWKRFNFFLKRRQTITVITGTAILVVC